MRRLLSLATSALLATACGAPQKPAATASNPTAARQQAQANAAPSPITQEPPRAPLAGPGASDTPSPVQTNWWTGRTDLFVAPTLHPSTTVKLGRVERFRLQNGLQVIVIARPGIPSMDISLAVKVGQSEDPLDKSGLAQFTASMLREGTRTRSADQIAQAIDFVGGELGAAADDQSTVVECHARTRDTALCLNLVSDVVEHPTFPAAGVAEIRNQLKAQIDGAKDSPQALASLHLANLYFGDHDPRGRPMSQRSLAAIDQAALIKLHKIWYVPNNAIVAISGDVNPRTVRKQLERAFAGWKPHAVPKRPLLPLPPAGDHLAVRIVDMPQATQSSIAIAGPGIAHDSPDFYATRLMNFTLGGGGFSSRLMEVVRARGGKTYGARSHFDVGRDPGPFIASTFTRNGQTVDTLKLVLSEIARMRKGGPTTSELEAAKGNLIGGYGLRLETAEDVARALLGARLDGLDPEFVQKYPARLAAVTLAQAKAAATAHLHPTALVVVGRASEIRPMLAKAGFVTEDVVAYTDAVSPAERAGTPKRSANP